MKRSLKLSIVSARKLILSGIAASTSPSGLATSRIFDTTPASTAEIDDHRIAGQVDDGRHENRLHVLVGLLRLTALPAPGRPSQPSR